MSKVHPHSERGKTELSVPVPLPILTFPRALAIQVTKGGRKLTRSAQHVAFASASAMSRASVSAATAFAAASAARSCARHLSCLFENS